MRPYESPGNVDRLPRTATAGLLLESFVSVGNLLMGMFQKQTIVEHSTRARCRWWTWMTYADYDLGQFLLRYSTCDCRSRGLPRTSGQAQSVPGTRMPGARLRSSRGECIVVDLVPERLATNLRQPSSRFRSSLPDSIVTNRWFFGGL